MALIKCDECGKEYSDKASACPNCGNPTNKGTNIVNKNSKDNKKKSKTGFIVVVIILIIFACAAIAISGTTDENGELIKYDTEKNYKPGEILVCPDFEVTIDNVQIKKKGTRIDSYQVISDPEWIGIVLTIKNTSSKTKIFYGSNVKITNKSVEVLDSSILSYSIWGAELLDSPKLVSGGKKTGYIQFSNTETDDSKLKLTVDCDTGLLDDEVIYTVDISK